MYQTEELPPQQRGLAAITAAMALIVVLLMVQIWLLSATLESYLAAETASTVGAAVFSGAIFVVCVGLYGLVRRIDGEVRKG